MIICSAPGKIILLGEHAVVYGHPALAVPVVEVQATAEVSGTYAPRPRVKVLAPDIGLEEDLHNLPQNDPIAAAIQRTLDALEISSPPSAQIRIKSTIPIAAGLGSGAAVSVAIIRALSTFLGAPLPDEQVSSIAFEVEKLHHGTPSGIDNTVITRGRPVYFQKDQPVISFHPGEDLNLVIGDSGITAPTGESVSAVRSLWEADKPRVEKIFDKIGYLVETAREKIEKSEWWSLGVLMDANHALLQELTVSCPELDRLVETARKTGALGAKLSGGGRGGNMIALAEKENIPAVKTALQEAGAEQVIVTTIQGVR